LTEKGWFLLSQAETFHPEREILWERGFDPDGLAGEGRVEAQAGGVKHLAIDHPELFRDCAPYGIGAITQDRMADVGKMFPDLVSATGFK
jgi:hypothetical protein